MVSNRVFLSSPHMGGNEEKYVSDAFEKNWIAPLGENVDEFENQIRQYTGANAACAVSSGTGAIHLALDVLNVGRGDVVFCSSLTFVASANPILYMGATPVFIDSEMDSWNMSPNLLEKAMRYYRMKGKLPKAVIVVNLYGQSARMDRIMEICDRYGVPVIEDAAESLGAEYQGQPSGTFGKIGVFSFNGNKIITTSGGGMMISDDELIIKKALKKATQSKEAAEHYQHNEVGYNYRLSNISAGIGRGQMEVLDDRIAKKRAIFEQYVDGFGDVSAVDFMPEIEGSFHTRWLSTMLIDPAKSSVTPSRIIKYLAQENIEARPVWKPLHMQPLFETCPYFRGEQDNAKYLFEHGLCLPSDTKMTEEEINRVITLVRDLLPIHRIIA
ncbi:DegT/DnrJ/EryC1/StrS family aminotransferase [Salinicoccus halitifaciens]|uniref:Pyridoxal phosphate-dependent aminotransferase EpsN n=1 Tax=Salinicoccus halitifaciens TaxID=1073415 RepID=A0ABV2E7R4_9STAP|nr:DegT/DnrJ/EryC1/StrS family aminotransferase [Salinicoccus halitifaciens]MCD2136473.1 DegT/DnrJ/EryC1/StrS family aminotransferase [Salinicoccus halitifaciens]